MQRYVLKSLVGLFFVVATSQVASGHTLNYLRALAEEAQADEQAAAVDSNVDQANTLGNPELEGVVKGNEKTVMRKFVNVELTGTQHTINQGQSYEVVCNVDASPEPKVFWIRGDNPTKQIASLFKTSVPSASSGTDQDSLSRVQLKYVVDCASQQDQGQIHCVAISGEKTALQSAVINVKENGNGTQSCRTNRAPVITHHTTTIFSLIGTSVILPCKAVGTPRPQTRWVDTDGIEITSHHYNPRYKVLNDGGLLIDDLEWTDMGGPACIAESSSGVDRAETFLYPVKREN